jgi:DNA-binding beta-propeller fold protein YncE
MSLLGCLITGLAVAAASSSNLVSIPLPGGAGGIGFDDLVFDAAGRRVLAPGGRTGRLYLVDPDSRLVTSVEGFAARKEYDGGHDDGNTSADAGRGLVFAVDRTQRRLAVVDPARRTIVARAALAASPDYVRFVEKTGEIWVTELEPQQIEVFALPTGGSPVPKSTSTIKVPGGPEALVVDRARGRAYTNVFGGAPGASAAATHAIAGRWANGCDSSRGLALDERRGFVFVACSEGKATVLQAETGKILSTISSGAGVDAIAYSPELGHLYVPGAKSATMAVLAVSPEGHLTLLGTVATVKGAHCVVADDRGRAFLCDQDRGQLLQFTDPFRAP